MRDYALGTTFDVKFTTRKFSTGAPFTLAGTPVISAYPDNSTTQITAGITLTVDFDSVTGLNNIRVVATSGNGYASGSNYTLVITTGTVDSVSVVGECVGEFSLEAQSPLRPTTAGRTIDVSAGGEAGVDWANVGSQSTSVNLSGTTVGTAAALTANNDKTGYRLSSAGVDDVLRTALVEAYAADGAAPTLSQLLFLLLGALTEFSISGTTITVKKLDGATTAATYTLDDGTNPTSRTRAT